MSLATFPGNELRDKVTRGVATQAAQYDVATAGAYEEVPVRRQNDRLSAGVRYSRAAEVSCRFG